MRRHHQKGLSHIAVILLIALAIGGYLLYSGKIILPQKQVNPTPIATTNEVDNWKTYTNSKHGYSLKYPSEWSYTLGKGTEDQMVFENMAMVITVTDDTEKPAIKSDGRNKATQSTQINIGGVTGEQATILDAPTGNVSYVQSAVVYNNKTYYFNLHNLNQQSIYDQMLSSFKFSSQTENSNWATYTSQNFGYQIKHPNLLLNQCSVGGISSSDKFDVVLSQGQPRKGTEYCGSYTISVFVDNTSQKLVTDKLNEFITFQTEKGGVVGGRREDYVQSETKIGTIPATKLTFKNSFMIYAFNKNSAIYYIQITDNTGGQYRDEVTKVVSTFKFN